MYGGCDRMKKEIKMFELKNATMIYDMDKEEKVYAMRNINLVFPSKGLVGIIGPSGSGKSTMMYTMSTLKNLTSGEILYNGKSITGIKESERQILRRAATLPKPQIWRHPRYTRRPLRSLAFPGP